MDDSNVVEEVPTSEKSKVGLGILISLIIAIINYFASEIYGTIAYIFGNLFIYLFLFIAVPCLVNYIIIRCISNNSVKIGLKIGFVIIIATFIWVVMSMVQSAVVYNSIETASSSGDEDLCDKIEGDAYVVEKNRCYMEVFLQTRDPTICDKMATGTDSLDYIKNECYSQAASETKDDSYCAKISSIPAQDQCYVGLGTSNLNLATCDKIQSQEKKDTCYKGIAMMKKEPAFFMQVCPAIKTQSLKDDCYLWHAAYSQDWTLCTNIQDPGIKSCCDRKEECVQTN